MAKEGTKQEVKSATFENYCERLHGNGVRYRYSFSLMSDPCFDSERVLNK